MRKPQSKSVKGAVSILLTVLVVLLVVILFLIGPKSAEAVDVSVTPSATDVVPGDTITFDVSIVIQSNERIPIENVNLRIFSDAECTTELTASPYSSPRSMSFVSATPAPGYGYGYLYGYDPNAGLGYSFGYGYGYGYGYGGSVTVVYRCTLDTTGWASSTYYARGDVDCRTHTYSSSAISFTVAPDWDVNADGCINVLDAILVGQHWGETGDPYWIREDINKDGEINVLDVILVGQHWGEGCGS